MNSKILLALGIVLLSSCTVAIHYQPAAIAATAGPQSDRPQLPPTYIPSGKQMYQDFCASCHGPDGKGQGPVASLFRKQPPDLTTLTKRHEGFFPREYVSNVLRFGPGTLAHGSSDMPVWGPIFRIVENYNEAAVRMRIRNLTDYLESIQEK